MNREIQLWKRNYKTETPFFDWFQIKMKNFKSQVEEG